MGLVTRWFIVVLALLAAAWLVPGIEVAGRAWIAYAVMAAVLAFVNAVIRPVLKFLTCPLIILTLGLFVLVINAGTLLLSAVITQALGVGFYVRSFSSAVVGALIVSVVTIVLSALVRDEAEKH